MLEELNELLIISTYEWAYNEESFLFG